MAAAAVVFVFVVVAVIHSAPGAFQACGSDRVSSHWKVKGQIAA